MQWPALVSQTGKEGGQQCCLSSPAACTAPPNESQNSRTSICLNPSDWPSCTWLPSARMQCWHRGDMTVVQSPVSPLNSCQERPAGRNWCCCHHCRLLNPSSTHTHHHHSQQVAFSIGQQPHWRHRFRNSVTQQQVVDAGHSLASSHCTGWGPGLGPAGGQLCGQQAGECA